MDHIGTNVGHGYCDTAQFVGASLNQISRLSDGQGDEPGRRGIVKRVAGPMRLPRLEINQGRVFLEFVNEWVILIETNDRFEPCTVEVLHQQQKGMMGSANGSVSVLLDE